jgi:hypothetical protein
MTDTPQRLQRSRAKGSRKPANTVCIGRPGPWGNPFEVGKDGDLATCIARFEATFAHAAAYQERARHALRGKNLACWCPLDAPCHGDVLLRWVNA